MTTNGADILSLLGSGIRPVEQTGVRQPARSGGPDFSAMLNQAQQGELRTGLDVAIAPALDLSLTHEQRAALSTAADKAESSGAAQSLVLMDEMALVLDVTARQIVDIADLSQVGVLTGIDSVVRASADASEQRSGNARVAPPGTVGNASLLDALSKIDQRRAGAA